MGGNSKGLTWSVNDIQGGNSAVGSISTGGAYFAPSSVNSQTTVIVTVTSPSIGKSARAMVTINPVVTITLSPTSATVNPGSSQQLNAYVSGTTNTSVAWSISPAVGTISAGGMYTAPKSSSSQQTVSVTATSMANNTKKATANLTLLSSMTVSVTPASPTLSPGQSQQFAAAVSGTSNVGVTWSLNPALGTISSTGLYVAPSSVTSQQSVGVVAVSTADPTKSAVAVVTLMPGSTISISMSPASATLAASQTQQFTASVAGSTNTGVTWTVSPMVGSISAGGLYTAPSLVASPQTVTVTATSASDPTKVANATVSLSPPSLTITTTSLPSGIVGAPYNATLAATGGLTPYTWNLASGQLPPSIALSIPTGTLSGTPTSAGTNTMSVQVSDAGGHTATAVLAITISACTSCSTPTAITTNLPNATAGVAYSTTLAATGGTPPYTWSLASGALPSGISLASSGTVFGTPASGGSYNFTANLSDSSVPAKTTSTALFLNVGHTVSLNWTDSGTSGVGYNVYRSNTPGGPYSKLTTSVQSTAGYVDTSVSAGQIYYYVTTAVNSTGESAYSNEAQAVVPFP
jgi:hypothetical protein